ncbi:MAG: hypothetical protein K2X26_10995 [Chitinophagaceae bacterium]|nr:hypothetical protein [Chitinophagaceae bacterium]MCA6439299.1 hypothetical protein [Chitinophagaceae bacterium]MCA6446705.1 hypothetical protein [Chitinophagaceae bacterium]
MNEVTRQEIARLVQSVIEKEGVKAIDIASKRGKSVRTIERYLKIAKALNIIEFKGVPKTGGYYLTKTTRDNIRE